MQANRYSGARALVLYVISASAVRVASEGVAIALVIAVRFVGAGSATAGLFVAAWSGPSVLSGVLVGHGLDRAARPKRYLAAAGCCAAAVLGVDALLLGRAPTGVLIVVTAAGGVVVPLFTGGMSALLPGLVRGEMLGRAQALDSATYSVSGIAGPALVALIAAEWSPRAALAIPALAVLIGSVAVPLRARRAPSAEHRERASPARTLRALGHTRELGAATAASTVAAFGWGGLEIGAVAIAALTSSGHLGGLYLAVLAFAALGAALALARVPLRRPDRAIVLSLAVMTGGAVIVAIAGSVLVAGGGFVLFGAGDGVLLPAVLAVRSRDAPPAMTAAVFTTAASLKTAAGALGAAVAGVALAFLGARGLFFALGATQLLGAAIAISVLARSRRSA